MNGSWKDILGKARLANVGKSKEEVRALLTQQDRARVAELEVPMDEFKMNRRLLASTENYDGIMHLYNSYATNDIDFSITSDYTCSSGQVLFVSPTVDAWSTSEAALTYGDDADDYVNTYFCATDTTSTNSAYDVTYGTNLVNMALVYEDTWYSSSSDEPYIEVDGVTTSDILWYPQTMNTFYGITFDPYSDDTFTDSYAGICDGLGSVASTVGWSGVDDFRIETVADGDDYWSDDDGLSGYDEGDSVTLSLNSAEDCLGTTLASVTLTVGWMTSQFCVIDRADDNDDGNNTYTFTCGDATEVDKDAACSNTICGNSDDGYWCCDSDAAPDCYSSWGWCQDKSANKKAAEALGILLLVIVLSCVAITIIIICACCACMPSCPLYPKMCCAPKEAPAAGNAGGDVEIASAPKI